MRYRAIYDILGADRKVLIKKGEVVEKAESSTTPPLEEESQTEKRLFRLQQANQEKILTIVKDGETISVSLKNFEMVVD